MAAYSWLHYKQHWWLEQCTQGLVSGCSNVSIKVPLQVQSTCAWLNCQSAWSVWEFSFGLKGGGVKKEHSSGVLLCVGVYDSFIVQRHVLACAHTSRWGHLNLSFSMSMYRKSQENLLVYHRVASSRALTTCTEVLESGWPWWSSPSDLPGQGSSTLSLSGTSPSTNTMNFLGLTNTAVFLFSFISRRNGGHISYWVRVDCTKL